jgi:POLQ-like helicase
LQNDIDIDGFIQEAEKNIFVSTPEKLYYLLKQFPELADKIGLLIYDEGHQFDSGTRGVIYELLVTSLKKVINGNTQVILISAVISNASNINNWLNSGNGIVVSGNTISTNRTIAFTSWTTQTGQLKFINKNNIDEDLYFVPRVLSQQPLTLSRGARVTRFFPEKNKNGQVATYLAFNLMNNGSVAVFIPRQVSINTLCSDINNAYRKGLILEKPIVSSNNEEINKLHYLYCKHLGEENEQTKAILLGVSTHHGNLPDSIKLSVEYSLQNSHIKIVFCTSTLAQGVNLPIRYLIITGVYQGKDQIKVRDFHNLIGRSGRAGKYTEGSIIFADIDIYDKKTIRSENWRWNNARKLLDSNNSEEIGSNILDIFSSIWLNENTVIAFDNIENLIILLNSDIQEIYERYDNSDVIYEFSKKRNFLLSIENFIIENFDDVNISIEELVRLTLAYHLADEIKKELLIKLFATIKLNIETKIPEDYKRKIYSKTLFGIYENKEINDWLDENIYLLVNMESIEQLENKIWYFIKSRIRNKNFRNFNQPQYLDNICTNWLNNKSYVFIYEELASLNIRMGNTPKARKLTVDYISEICEKALSFEGTLILSSVIAFLDLYKDMCDITNLAINLNLFQKKLKYGLSSRNAIFIYEMGFVDKFISLELSNLIEEENLSFMEIKEFLQINVESVENVLNKYPSYFIELYKSL